MPEPPHFRRILILWAALSIIATPIVVLVWAPDLPPGNGTNAASGQVTDNTVLLGVVTPIAALMIVYFAYALIVFRRRDEGPEEGLAIRGNRGIQTTWLAATSVIVLLLAGYGTIRLFDEGAGGGQGADPVAKPSGSVLPVQVIAQQWAFTYRYPTFGGVETPHLALPVDRNIALHVTSLLVMAPLEEMADPTRTPNPAKAPWYFLGLQELVHYSAFVGGVLIPTLLVVALVALPYVDRHPRGGGRWFAPERRVANTVFTALALTLTVLTIIGTFFRGANWAWTWPW